MDTMTITEMLKDKAIDRRVIRIEAPPPNAGITAALRRAFVTAHADSSDSDFDKLLARLG